MHKRARDRAGAGVQIFVRTPHREIDIPFMQRERHVAGSVCEIEPNDDSMFLACSRELFDVD
jgi:hypothetical protein